jgi:nucleotide-binding universal stress UspA family protein
MSEFLKHILWATDFSDEGQEALLYADYFAKAFKSRLSALHVVSDFSSALYESSPAVEAELISKIELVKNNAASKLESIAKGKGISLDKVIVKEGSASKKIIETASEVKADLIVMGRKGLSGLEKLFIGSVANHVLRSSPVPVLVTKKKRGEIGIKKILVPTDFSKQEEIEQDLGIRLSGGFCASMTLLYVLELFGHDLRLVDELFKDVLAKLKKKSRRETCDVQIDEEVYKAHNAPAGIVDYAETHQFDLIVMSTYIHKLERFFLGSTTEKVISYTNLPVFAIPPSCQAD